jgi:hypothetical protein
MTKYAGFGGDECSLGSPRMRAQQGRLEARKGQLSAKPDKRCTLFGAQERGSNEKEAGSCVCVRVHVAVGKAGLTSYGGGTEKRICTAPFPAAKDESN